MPCNVLEINQTNLTGGVIRQGNTTHLSKRPIEYQICAS